MMSSRLEMAYFSSRQQYRLNWPIKCICGRETFWNCEGQTVRQTTLFGIVRHTPSDGTVGISLKPFAKADVPIGTEIWKVG